MPSASEVPPTRKGLTPLCGGRALGRSLKPPRRIREALRSSNSIRGGRQPGPRVSWVPTVPLPLQRWEILIPQVSGPLIKVTEVCSKAEL